VARGASLSWFALSAAATAVECASAAAIRILYGGAFGLDPWLGQGACVGASYAILFAGGLAACALACGGAYAAVARLRPVAAALVVCLVSAPLVLAAVTGVYGALVCLAVL
jgi:hypothetical protein